MRGIRLIGVVLALLGWHLPTMAQLVVTTAGGPLSVFEYQLGTYTTTNHHHQAALLKLALTSDQRLGRRAPRYATLVSKGRTGLQVRLDSATAFTIADRHFVRLTRLTADNSLKYDIASEFVELLADTGRIELYAYYPLRGNGYVLSAASPGVIHEDDLRRSFIWRRRGIKEFEVMNRVPPRGYGRDFERQLRALFSDRPDILAYIAAHEITARDLPAVVKAYNSGVPIRFE